MKGLIEKIATFGDALECKGEFLSENPEREGDISFRIVQIVGGYLKGTNKPCEGCRCVLRNTKGEVALVFITRGRAMPDQKTEGCSRGLAKDDAYIVCGQSCDDPTTPDELIPDEQKDLPLIDIAQIVHCDKKRGLN